MLRSSAGCRWWLLLVEGLGGGAHVVRLGSRRLLLLLRSRRRWLLVGPGGGGRGAVPPLLLDHQRRRHPLGEHRQPLHHRHKHLRRLAWLVDYPYWRPVAIRSWVHNLLLLHLALSTAGKNTAGNDCEDTPGKAYPCHSKSPLQCWLHNTALCLFIKGDAAIGSVV